MIKMDDIQIGNKFVMDNSIGLFDDIEKTNIVVTVIEKIDQTKLKVEISSILLKEKVQKEVEYFLLR